MIECASNANSSPSHLVDISYKVRLFEIWNYISCIVQLSFTLLNDSDFPGISFVCQTPRPMAPKQIDENTTMPAIFVIDIGAVAGAELHFRVKRWVFLLRSTVDFRRLRHELIIIYDCNEASGSQCRQSAAI